MIGIERTQVGQSSFTKQRSAWRPVGKARSVPAASVREKWGRVGMREVYGRREERGVHPGWEAAEGASRLMPHPSRLVPGPRHLAKRIAQVFNARMEDFLWGVWNGLSAWPLLIVHIFDIWERYPVYNVGRDGGWYQFGFLLGAGSPFLGMAGGSRGRGRGSD